MASSGSHSSSSSSVQKPLMVHMMVRAGLILGRTWSIEHRALPVTSSVGPMSPTPWVCEEGWGPLG